VLFRSILTFGLVSFNKGIIKSLKIINFLVRLLQFTCLFMDKVIFREEFAWAYLVVVQKPEE
jgi:hypothetical protein